MKRSQFQRILSAMNSVREAIYQASSQRELRRLHSRYAKMSNAVAPYVESKKKFDPEQATA